MTTLDPIPDLTPPTEPWNDLFAKLRLRYPKVREPIVAALAALMQNPGSDVDHAKAVAAANGMRITAASVAAAERLLSRQDDAPEPKAKATPARQTAHVRRPRAPVQELDTEALIKQVVDKIEDAGNAEADRLRDGIRKAIAGLQAVLDSRQPAHDLQSVGRAEPYADRLDVFANQSAHVVTGSPRPATAGKNKTTMMNDLNETRGTLR